MSAVRVVALVSGDVQGVGFRWFVSRLAAASGLAGSARNLSDSRVEVVLEGEPEAVRAAVAALSGPDAPGSVSGVDQRDETVQGVHGFTVE